jgi:hypothetical protein
MKTIQTLLCLGAFFSWAAGLSAQPAALPPLPPESHQFDFWIGEWEVFNPDGTLGGHSRVEGIAEGHALLENWTDADGSSGKSLNVYNVSRKQWQQFWVGSETPVLELRGGLQNGSMVLTGRRTLSGGGRATDRLTWTPNADGTVRQLWEISRDNGKTWQTNFDGLYRRKK